MCARVGALGGGGTLAPAEGLHGSCQGNPEWAPCQSGLCVREPRLSWFRQWGFPSRTIAPSRLRKGQRLGESQGLMEAVGPSPVCPHSLDPGGWFQGKRLPRAGSSKGEDRWAGLQVTRALFPDYHVAGQSGQGADHRL